MNLADFYDAELARHNVNLRAAADVGVRDRVLDVGWIQFPRKLRRHFRLVIPRR